MKRLLVLLTVALSLLIAADAPALTPPLLGATLFPQGQPLPPPFPAATMCSSSPVAVLSDERAMARQGHEQISAASQAQPRG